MKCPVCGGAELVPGTKRLMPFEWQGKETMLEGIGDACPLCGEVVLTDESCKQIEEQIRAFKGETGSALNDYIRSIRKKLGLSQKEASEIFGGGVNAFSRYELGKINPPKSLVLLFQLLEKNPALLDEIGGNAHQEA